MKNDHFFLNPRQINRITKSWHLLTTNQHYYPVFWFMAGLMLVMGDSKLIFATAIAISVMLAIYRSEQFNWKAYLRQFSQLLTGANRQLALAVVSGGIVAIASYSALAIWAEIDNHWLATVLITQGFVTTIGLGVVLYYLFKQKNLGFSSVKSFADLVTSLTDNSGITRLLTINQLMQLWEKQKLTPQQISELQNYFYLMKKAETDQTILMKIEESLSRLLQYEKFNSYQPLNIPSSKNKITENLNSLNSLKKLELNKINSQN
jgi:hypothetical protein